MLYLLTQALVYTVFYAGLVYLPLRLIVDGVCMYQVRTARKRAEQARKASRPRTA